MKYSYVCIDEALEVLSECGYVFDENINSFEESENFEMVNITVALTDDLSVCFNTLNIGPCDEFDEIWRIYFIYKVKEGYAVNKKYKRELREFFKERIDKYAEVVEEEGEVKFFFIEFENYGGPGGGLRKAIEFMTQPDVLQRVEAINDHIHEKVRKEGNDNESKN